MERKEYFGVLTLLAVICSVVADGKLSFGSCPNVPVPNLRVRDVVGTWFVVLETDGKDSCVSYEFEQLDDDTDGLIKKTSLGGRGEYDFDYGAMVKTEDHFHFVWPGSFEVTSGSFVKYDDNTMGLFTCESRSLLRKQTAYLLSKNGVVQELALESFVHNVIAFKLHADDFKEVNQQSCPRVLITSVVRESDLRPSTTSTTRTLAIEPTLPTSTREYTPRTTQSPTIERTTSRGMSFDESDWHSEHSRFDIPWLPAVPSATELEPLPVPIPTKPYTTIRPTTTTSKRTTPRTTDGWTTVGSVHVVEHEADARSEEASRELEF